ncbi:putative lipoprotein [Ralstonia solanacearum CMR15]|nr:putative lipoprotein [Ralstonia solanacearum CMR15]
MRFLRRLSGLLGAAVVVSAGMPAAHAEESQFAYVYTTDLLPKGAKEIEQWMTWRHQKAGGAFDQVEGRTEVEYGLTDRLQVALYGNYAWARAYHNGPYGATTPPEQFADKDVDPDARWSDKRFVGVSAEAIYRVLSPYTDGVGLAFYVEPTIGPQFKELETKVILQKNFLDDRLITAFNFTYAPEWRYLADDAAASGKSWQEETDINFNFAVSYRFAPNWSAGVEFVNEREYNSYRFRNQSNGGYYFGPSIHYGGKNFFVTATFLEQLPWAHAHADTVDGTLVSGRTFDNDFEKYRVRIKMGYYF